jgi:hypothetical protein
MCTVLLPPGVNPIAVDRYISISISIVRITDLELLRYDTIYVLNHNKIFQWCACCHQVSCSSYFSDVPAVTKFPAVHVSVMCLLSPSFLQFIFQWCTCCHQVSCNSYFSDVPAVTKFPAIHIPAILNFYIFYKTFYKPLILNSILFTTLFFNLAFRSESYFLGLNCDFLILFLLPFCSHSILHKN